MSPILTIAFWVAWISLAAWFFFKKDDRKGQVFGSITIAGLLLWVAGWYVSEGSLSVKMGFAVRDLFILAASGLFFLSIVSSKTRFWIGISAAAVAIYLLRGVVLPTPTPGVPDQQDISLDQNGEWLIELREGVQVNQLSSIIGEYDLQFVRAFQPASPELTELDDYYVVDVPNPLWSKREAIAKELMSSNLVDWIEPNEQVEVAPIIPAKKLPGVNRKFGVNDPGLEQQWAMSVLNADALYTYFRKQNIKPKHKARIAILDTGVDSKHEDLSEHFISIKGKYDNDPRGHGTHCAGIAGAVTNNGRGIAGLANGTDFISISSIKVLSAYGGGTQKGIVDGMIEAADNGVDVISMSLGGMSNQSKQQAYNQAVKYANKKGAIVVCAAGNSNRNAKGYSPVNSKGVIGVSALDSELNRAVFSNTVNDIEMGIAAPGVDIYSTLPGDKYKALSGTSMATPYVAGLLGLMRSLDPDINTKEAYRILHESGQTVNAGDATGRLIQPQAAIEMMLEQR